VLFVTKPQPKNALDAPGIGFRDLTSFATIPPQRRHPNGESPPMPSAPVLETAESPFEAEPPAPVAAGAAMASETHAAPVLHLVPAATAVPTASVRIPAEPTARIHWIGSYVHDRHPADLYTDIVAGAPNLVVVDARYAETYAVEHLPGAINLPWRDINETTTAHLSREALYVVYCWNASCHASTKTAQRLEGLGFRVKELHGGLQDWKKQGYPTERA
jgi:rhodanese-related sulfurtransferase